MLGNDGGEASDRLIWTSSAMFGLSVLERIVERRRWWNSTEGLCCLDFLQIIGKQPQDDFFGFSIRFI